MSEIKSNELKILEEICEKLVKNKELINDCRVELLKIFSKRFENAMRLIDEGKIKKYLFFPSGRTIWCVSGRKADYQVIPNINYCSCDDYYFRVLNHKKQLCYHLIAQKIAEAIGRFKEERLQDKEYNLIIDKLKPKGNLIKE
jgi:predicted nucleic acid-binding Zn finger protein